MENEEDEEDEENKMVLNCCFRVGFSESVIIWVDYKLQVYLGLIINYLVLSLYIKLDFFLVFREWIRECDCIV